MSKAATIVSWIARLPAAGILAMAGFMKVSGDPGSVYLMETLLGAPSVARIGLGAVEIVAAIALLVPATAVYGALLAAALMVGAIGSHVTKLGIAIEPGPEVSDEIAASIEGPAMFGMAVVVLVGAAATAFLTRSRLPFFAADAENHAAEARGA